MATGVYSVPIFTSLRSTAAERECLLSMSYSLNLLMCPPLNQSITVAWRILWSDWPGVFIWSTPKASNGAIFTQGVAWKSGRRGGPKEILGAVTRKKKKKRNGPEWPLTRNFHFNMSRDQKTDEMFMELEIREVTSGRNCPSVEYPCQEVLVPLLLQR